jgi:ABC-type phosphate transport system ATPase subunit
MSSLEERDPLAAIEALEEGIEDREGRVRHHQAEIARHLTDVASFRETLGMVKARNPSVVSPTPSGGEG